MANVNFILSVYNQIKKLDITDVYIVKTEFPKHGIFISYRTWMTIKSTETPINH